MKRYRIFTALAAILLASALMSGCASTLPRLEDADAAQLDGDSLIAELEALRVSAQAAESEYTALKESLEAQIEAGAAQREALMESIDACCEEISSLSDELIIRETQLADAMEAASEYESSAAAYILSLENNADGMKNASSYMSSMLSSQAASIKAYKEQIDELNKRIDSINGQLSAKNSENAALSDRINALLSQIAALQAQINGSGGSGNVPSQNDDGVFNYVAVGNSITWHGGVEYWPNNTAGMAASTADKDYVHIVEAFLKKNHDKVSTQIASFVQWELLSHDRAEYFFMIDSYLNAGTDLVTVQLGENATDLSTFESDMEELLRHIKIMAPNAQVILIDDFWGYENRSQLKLTAATNTHTGFADLTAIRDNEDYMCGMGTTVYDEKGGAYTVNHEGVANHPGDKGMAYIAARVTELIGE